MVKEKNRSEIDNKYKWDLTLIYKTEKEFNEDLEKVSSLKDKLLTYRNKVLDTSKTLEEATDLYFEIEETLEKLFLYAHLCLDTDVSNSKNQIIYGKVARLYTIISTSLSFYAPEVLNSSLEKVNTYLKENPNLNKYKFTFNELFRSKRHHLDTKQEELLSSAEEALHQASETYDMLTNNDLSFESIKDENGKTYPLNESKYQLYLKSNSRLIRKNAFENLYKTYKQYRSTITETFKGSIKKDSFYSKVRNYNSTLEMALDSDNIPITLYQKLIKTVSDNLDVSKKYIKLKKDVLNIDELHMYDLYVPLVSDISKKYTFEEAKEIVLEALKPLGQTYIKDLKNLLEAKIIDVYPNKGKSSGAYASSCYDSMPYVLLNFEGTFNDVSTLAHELGHAMHYYYSNKNNLYCDKEYTILLAEIASTVNEILLNKYAIEHAKDKKEKLYFLNHLLDDLRATLIRQTMFAEFELLMHTKDENNEVLSEEEISEIYYKLNKKYYGEDLIHDDEIRYEWLRIPHFYSSYYVYQYATGISIASKIALSILDNKKEAKENYLNLLKSGGKDYSLSLLKKVDIDIVNDDTIQKALELFEETIKEFKETYKEVGE